MHPFSGLDHHQGGDASRSSGNGERGTTDRDRDDTAGRDDHDGSAGPGASDSDSDPQSADDKKRAQLKALKAALATMPVKLVRAGDSDDDVASVVSDVDDGTGGGDVWDASKQELVASKAYKRLTRRVKKLVKKLGRTYQLESRIPS